MANLVLDWADDDNIPISNLKLQKLLYFLHADWLLHNGEPLLSDCFEAWRHGPVLPSIYRNFAKFEKSPIKGRIDQFDPFTGTVDEPRPNLTKHEQLQLHAIFRHYVQFKPYELSDITHRIGGPWFETRRLSNRISIFNSTISNEVIALCHHVCAGDN